MENSLNNSLLKTVGEYNFKKDIISGEQGEEFVKQFLISKNFKFLSDNKNNKYDLLMSYNNSHIKYEIKTDILLSKERDTGNMVVEFESRDKPSGISVTQADYYVYYIPKLGEIWNIKMSYLKNLIETENFRIVSGGDIGSNTKMYLIPRNKYSEHFKIHKL
jgi:hypothetical protein